MSEALAPLLAQIVQMVAAAQRNRARRAIAAGVLYPVFGLLLSPMIATPAMSFSSVSVIAAAARENLTPLLHKEGSTTFRGWLYAVRCFLKTIGPG